MTARETRSRRRRDGGRAACLALGLLLIAWTPVRAEHGYSYIRTVEGYADLETAEDGLRAEVRANHPLVAGDVLLLDDSARVEAVLADGTVLRIGGGNELHFEALAWTLDSDDDTTRLWMPEGELQIVLGSELSAGPALEIEIGNATVFLEAPGDYWLLSRGRRAAELVVRHGFAELVTASGSTIARSAEVAYVDGDERPTVELASAPGRTRLEAWGDDLDAEARLAELPYVEPELRYRAARMARYGSWIDVGGRHGWQPRVAAGWRPYVSGSWVYTPSGLTWVSNEPWGWVPAHYGSWDLVPGRGWVWFAGSHYSPAAVYWYWGPTHVAWVPSGYYTRYYGGGAGYGPRLAVYGWAGGGWDAYAEWTFCPTRYFGRGRYDRYFRSGQEIARHVTYREIPRGVIATDTRSLRRELWGSPDRVRERLTAAHSRLGRGELRDVTAFVARERDIRPEIAEITRPRLLSERTRSKPAMTPGRPATKHPTRLQERTVERRQLVTRRSTLPARSTSKPKLSERSLPVRPLPPLQTQRAGSVRSERSTTIFSRSSGVRQGRPEVRARQTPASESSATRRTEPERPPVVSRVLGRLRSYREREAAPKAVDRAPTGPVSRAGKSTVQEAPSSRTSPPPARRSTASAPKPQRESAASPPRSQSRGKQTGTAARSSSKSKSSGKSSNGKSTAARARQSDPPSRG